jgi:hypothetical protein
MRGVPHLKELFTKYHDRGFELVAVSNETEAKIDGFVTGTNKPNYTVVRYSKIAEEYGVKGWPSAWVVDSEGKVLWADHFIDKVTDEQWETWLKDVAPAKVGREVAKELKGSVTAFNKGEYGKSLAELEKVASETQDEAVKADAEYVKGLLQRRIDGFTTKIAKADETGDLALKGQVLAKAAAQFEGSTQGETWATELKELEKSDAYKDTVKASEALEKLRPTLEDMKPSSAKKALEKIAKKYPETKAGKEAAELAKRYEE